VFQPWQGLPQSEIVTSFEHVLCDVINLANSEAKLAFDSLNRAWTAL
jgi:hypothetical protein